MPKTLEQHLAPGGPKRILSLDGGGVKGIMTLGMLAAIEAELRERSRDPNLVLSDYYDLIGGTSTGAIIATGLALGKSVAEMTDLYRTLGPRVFKRKRGSGYLLKSAYDHRELTAALDPVLGDTQLGDSDAIKTGLSIHMKRIDTGSPWVLTNSPRSPYFGQQPNSSTIPNSEYRLADLVRASAAAPTFFDEVLIATEFDVQRNPMRPGYFVDGAVSANNNPSLQLLLTAIVPQYGLGWAAGENNLMMTSMGTGLRRPRALRSRYRFELSALKAVSALRAMIYDTQVQGIALMQALSKPRMGWVVNSEIGDMAGGPFSGQAVLDYQRIDASLELRKPAKGDNSDLEESTWLGLLRRRFQPAPAESLLGEQIGPRALVALDELANGNPENISLLLRIGEATGKRFVSAEYPDPKFDLPEWRAA